MTDRLAQIQARADAATEGPWEIKEDCRDYPSVWHDREAAFSIGRCADCGVEAEYERGDAEFIAHARTDVPALLAMVRERDAALERVRKLHQPEKRWTHPDWTGSFDTREEAAEYDYDEAMGDDHKSQVDHFEVCAECGHIEAEQLRESGDEWSYRESFWPCRTIAAITATEGADDGKG